MRRKWFDPEHDLTVEVLGYGFDTQDHIVIHCIILDENFMPTDKTYVVYLNDFIQKFQEVEE